MIMQLTTSYDNNWTPAPTVLTKINLVTLSGRKIIIKIGSTYPIWSSGANKKILVTKRLQQRWNIVD